MNKRDVSPQTHDAPASETAKGDREEAGRDDIDKGRTARDATSINPKKREPIDPAMPNMPPA